jgi:hypothetical protein
LYLDFTRDAIGVLIVEVHDYLATAHLSQASDTSTIPGDLRVIAVANLLLFAIRHFDCENLSGGIDAYDLAACGLRVRRGLRRLAWRLRRRRGGGLLR